MENKTFYTLAALSDVYYLISEAKKDISAQKNYHINNEFKIKFQSKIDLGSFDITKNSLSLLMKKIEFYIAWLKSQSQLYDITEGEAV